MLGADHCPDGRHVVHALDERVYPSLHARLCTSKVTPVAPLTRPLIGGDNNPQAFATGVCAKERDRQREREIETDRERERDRQRQTETEKW